MLIGALLAGAVAYVVLASIVGGALAGYLAAEGELVGAEPLIGIGGLLWPLTLVIAAVLWIGQRAFTIAKDLNAR